MNVIVTYDFAFTAENKPWYYVYTIIVENENNTIHSETFHGFDPLEFERLRENAIAEGIPLDVVYTNPATKTHSETYHKSWK